ncbi:related to Enolase-phosphatase E1 [Ramularia collo-cygni]|uniref:Related to Enolase-phosphatase E1 n=1 Tax=Ramularia collo-cygni TaxID=112498 RepID=A0A2D3V348_9PEZI|nr:related to Enolase-phosphatase E1 [Ramularia collo-cygni]CZT19107.1 related to Enolase-phosphatase E1 [Ramularia collo-cygni]
MDGVNHVLLDIEGTVCPIAFVKEILFPYAIDALPNVLSTQWDSESFRPYREAFPEEHRTSPEALQAHVEDLTRRDVKIAYLKNLQGMLWEHGYRTGAYSTPLFSDVVPQLRNWASYNLGLSIYSSGSVFAQKLLFGHVQAEAGLTEHREALDLTSLFEGWFDTVNAGLKTDQSSYTKIAGALKRNPEEILFLSDNVKEVDAAVHGGMKSILVDRPGNAEVSREDRERLTVVQSLGDINL